ncbi:polymorphic outer membrane protein family [Chlamydia pneumoniae LPCoLN]|uniref:autotransporter domain-containing protein n=1 Tax=Chlamydia pneumoniae TaxID=83558 RepID=UPI0001BD9BD8|nr:autotransporter domain-containing protein [Chlamydia pneumoniae]ACZ32854.1 polymorphic outer membrane protein family [Chlamydia pneumoniae LPCoLN]
MVAKKTVRSYRSSFSHSVIVAILSAGIAFEAHSLHSSELDLGVFNKQFEEHSAHVEEAQTPVLKGSDPVNPSQKESEKVLYTQVPLTQGSSGESLDLADANFLEHFQHLFEETTVFGIDQKLVWSDLDTRNFSQPTQEPDTSNAVSEKISSDTKENRKDLETEDPSKKSGLKEVSSDLPKSPETAVAAISEDLEISENISARDPLQGLAFFYKNTSSQSISEKDSSFQGIIFSGSGANSGLGFENLKAPKSGAAVYSDRDIVFENLAKGLSFISCESLEDGSAAGVNIVVTHCGDVTLTDCATGLDLEALRLVKDFSRGGAVFTARNHEVQNNLAGGILSVVGNKGAIVVEKNSAEKSNGGAFACGSFVYSNNENTALWKENQALSGGAISSASDIDIQGNCSAIEFSGNQSLIALGEHIGLTDFVGGGALAAQGTLTLRNNAVVQCVKNTSKTHGGAILAGTVDLNETISEVAFKQNTAALTGGALSANDKVIIANNFGEILFEQNEVRNHGGAIYCGCRSNPKLEQKDSGENINIIGNSGAITFLKNKASVLEVMTQAEDYAGGGALWGHNVLLDSNSGNIQFIGNIGGSTFWIGEYVGGGAILSTDRVTISNNSGDVVFKGNKGQCLAQKYVAPQETAPVESDASSTNKDEKSLNACSHGDHYPPKTVEEEVPPSLLEEHPVVSSTDIRGGGAILAQHIFITDNTGNLRFSGNLGGGEESSTVGDLAIVGGGALLSTNEVNVCSNQNVVFSDNVTSNGCDSGGAILAKKVDISANHSVEFVSNGSGKFGGAVCALNESVNITDNGSAVSFSKNRTRLGGAGVAAPQGSVTICGNQGNIAFKENFVFGSENQRSGGGAIIANSSVNIQDNAGDILFVSNSTGSYGGAIFVGSLVASEGSNPRTLTITGNSGDILFAKNSTQTAASLSEKDSFGGGAIYTQNLKIVKNAGNVSFYGNRAPSGAGVQIADGGTVCLEAFGGDILFEGNINFDGSFNAIHLCGNDSKIVELSAVQDKNIIFQDAITYEENTIRGLPDKDVSPLSAPSLIFNSKPQDDSAQHHEGTIRFSRGVSKIPQIAAIQEGTLALSQNAELWLAGLKQETGSSIVLSAGSILRIFDSQVDSSAPLPTENKEETLVSAGVQINMSSPTPNKDKAVDTPVLADIISITVDLSSFVPEQDGTLPLPPEIIIPKGTKLHSNAIDLKIIDPTNVGYENHALLSSHKDIPLISLKTAEGMTGTPTADASLSNIKIDVSLPSITPATYGHTGVWSESKMEDGRLIVGWQPTGYKLNPEKQGALVLNNLWSHYTDLRALKQEIFAHHTIAQRMELDFSTNVWGSGLGVVEDCQNIGEFDGFKHHLTGYSLGLDTQLVEDFLIGGCFSQFFGKTESQSYKAKNDVKSYMGAAYAGILAGPWLIKGAFVYGNINNDLTTDYGTLGISTGSWIGKGFIAGTSIDYRYIVNPRRFISAIVSTVVPFVEAEYVRIDLPEISEQGKEVRTFQKTRFENVAIPFGFALEHAYSRGSRAEVNSVQLAYVFDVYRKRPVSLITLKDAAYSWKSYGVDIPCKAWKARLSNNTEWNSYLSTYLAFNYEWREDLIAYDFNGGIRIIF